MIPLQDEAIALHEETESAALHGKKKHATLWTILVRITMMLVRITAALAGQVEQDIPDPDKVQ